MTAKEYFTPLAATQALPLVKPIVKDILATGQRLSWLEKNLGDAYETDTEVTQRIKELHELLCELENIGCSFKDWDFAIGIVDFPAIINDAKVMLCWRGDEDRLEYYHFLNTGYETRQPIPPQYLEEEPAKYNS